MSIKNKGNFLKKFQNYSLVSIPSIVCVILFIWTIPNTIAFRNILLAVGAINAVYICITNSHLWIQQKNRWLPLLSLGLLYLWVLVHYNFFTLNQELEWGELKSLWVRSLAGSLIALALPICFSRKIYLKNYFYLFLFSTPIINITIYIYYSLNTGVMLTPQDYVVDFYFKKIETVFFGSIAAVFAAANLYFLIASNVQQVKFSKNLQILMWILGFVICFISSVISNTKNGILILLFIVFLLTINLVIYSIKNHKFSRPIFFLVIGLVFFSVIALKAHTHYSTGGWNSLVADIKVAINVDDYLKWKLENHDSPLPINEEGSIVSGSTYMRVAWAIVGLRLIERYPLGYGSINTSYNGLLNLDGSDPGQHGQTHSGWIDFGLAYGIPGLICLFSALIAGIIMSRGLILRDRIEITYLMIVFLPLSLIAETAWKQYFEATLFFITYTSALLILKQDDSEIYKR